MSYRGLDDISHKQTRSRLDDARLGFILVAGAAVLLAALVLTVLQLFTADDSTDADVVATEATVEVTAPTEEPTEAPVTEEPEPTEVAPENDDLMLDPDVDTTPVEREAPVSILNQTTIAGLAARTSEEVTTAGWTVSGTGNWIGTVSESTVFYPEGLHEQAILLAMDLDLEAAEPVLPGMSAGQLTVVLTADR